MNQVRIVRHSSIAAITLLFAAAYGCSGSSSDDSSSGAGSSSGGASGNAGVANQAGTGVGGHSGTGTGGSHSGGMTNGGTEAGGTDSGGTTAGGTDSGGTDSGGTAGGSAGTAGTSTGGSGGTTAGTGGSGGQAPTCFVPYGCAAYACDAIVSDGDAGAGGATDDGEVTVHGATPTDGPRAGLSGEGGAPGDSSPGANEAYSFTGADDLLGFDSNLPQGASARTMTLWVEPAAGPVATFFNYGSFVAHERFGLLLDSNKDYFVGEGSDLLGNVNLATGPWHHVAASYDGTTMTLYVDGVLDKAATLQATLATLGSRFAIGHTVTTVGREPFNGKISDIRVYNRVLSAGEVAQLATFSGGAANPESLRSTTSGLVFWLPLISSPEVMRNRCAP
jgi:hypothetical protein